MAFSFKTEKLFGLLLTGGKSQRMGKDKAGLCYAGRPQIDRAMEWLGLCTEEAFLSLRKDQALDRLRQKYQPVFDPEGITGPNAGLLAAHRKFPEAAWLVLACDLPFADEKALAPLVRARAEWQGEKQDRPALFSWKSSFHGWAEPLCAIWEPEALESLEKAVAEGAHCPRQAYADLKTVLLEPEGAILENVNTPEEWQKIQEGKAE